ncbi:MAG: hypothetical protein JWQ48_200 [Conexibacter sp.]|nr:hypothetical protein [Conexibacter sp.]
MAERDRYRERRWLEGVTATVPNGFVAHARDRLEMGEALYGARWATAGIAQLLAELAEEAADLGAWSALALQALDGGHLDPLVRVGIVGQLSAIARAGAEAHAAVETGIRLLARAEAGRTKTSPDVARTRGVVVGGA